jgi:hypothetical protein
MHATNVERNSWRLPPDDTVQVADQRSKSAEVRLDIIIRDCDTYLNPNMFISIIFYYNHRNLQFITY